MLFPTWMISWGCVCRNHKRMISGLCVCRNHKRMISWGCVCRNHMSVEITCLLDTLVPSHVFAKSLVWFVSDSCHFECDVIITNNSWQMKTTQWKFGVFRFEFDKQISHGCRWVLLDFTQCKRYVFCMEFIRNGGSIQLPTLLARLISPVVSYWRTLAPHPPH